MSGTIPGLSPGPGPGPGPSSGSGDSSGSGGAASGTGTLNINSIPVSKVVLDGKPLGNTPKIGVSVPVWTHTVTFAHGHVHRATPYGPRRARGGLAALLSRLGAASMDIMPTERG